MMKTTYSYSQKAYLKELGATIRALRLKKKLSQEILAEKSNLDRTYIGGVERGERNISILNLKKIATALHVDISLIFKGLDS